MKKILLFTITLFSIFNEVHSQTSYSKSLSCHRGSFSLGYAQQNPLSDSLPSIGNFTMEATFLKRHHRFFNTSFGIETNFGAKSYDEVIENIEFEGGYLGFASYSINRFDVWGKYLFGAQVGKIVEFSIPLKVGYRTTSYSQEFDIYEGQEIAQEDLATQNDAEEENNDVFFRSNKLGFGTGVNLAFFPNGVVSPFVELGYTYFGEAELPRPDKATMNNGDIIIPNISLANNNELTFRVGLRFNIGCPSNMLSVYRKPSNTGRNVVYTKHPEVKTTIIDRNIDTQSNTETESNSEESEKVILKPKKPTRKP
ncbi:MAG: hypothetical protein WEA99_13490 [Brumimicrobium sp.]